MHRWLRVRGKDSPPDWGCGATLALTVVALVVGVTVLVEVSSRIF